jgi:hypothetical protein
VELALKHCWTLPANWLARRQDRQAHLRDGTAQTPAAPRASNSAPTSALFDEAADGDIAAIEEQLAALQATTLPPKPEDGDKQAPKRAALPARLPRVERHHEPDNTTCGCQMSRIGEDVSEKLDYTPGVFTVEATCAASGLAPSAARRCRPQCRQR